jgi:hypothetical protein
VKIVPTVRHDCLIQDFRVGQFFSLLSKMPGRKKWVERELAFEPTGANIAYLLEHCPDAVWADGAEKLRDNYVDLKMREQNTRELKKEELVDDSGYEFHIPPFKHQRHAFLLSKNLDKFALFHEQGTGKTKVIIDTAAYLFEKGEIDTLIVVANNGVHINWVTDEIPVHMPSRISYHATYFSINWRDAEAKAMMAAATVPTPGILRIITFHVEGIKYQNDGSPGKLQSLIMEWLLNNRVMLVIDESSTIKNPSADRTKFLIKAGQHAVKKRIMTGTPLTSGIENLFSQFKFLDPGILGHNSFTSFRSEYCIMGGFENRVITGYRNIEKLIDIIAGHSHRVLERDCLDLPPRRYKRRQFQLAPTQQRLYDAYRKDSLKEVQAILGEAEGLKRAQEIALVKALRLHQIVCGLSPSDKPERMDGPNPRMTATLEEVEEGAAGGHKVIIWARFKVDLREIHAKLGKQAVGYYGGISEDDCIAARMRFQDDDKVRYFVASRKGARGITLTAAERTVYHSQTSSLDDRLQSEKRNHRIGTTGSVLYTDLEAACVASPDRKIINALRKHKELADQINQDPASIFMEDSE